MTTLRRRAFLRRYLAEHEAEGAPRQKAARRHTKPKFKKPGKGQGKGKGKRGRR